MVTLCFKGLPAVLGEARIRLEEAVAWDRRQAEDTKLRLKALASQFFIASDHTHEDPECPLCESKLSGDKRKALASELGELKKASLAAERKLSDVCSELESKSAVPYLQGSTPTLHCSPVCNLAIPFNRR